MPRKTTLAEKLLQIKLKPGELTHGEWKQTPEGQAYLLALEAAVARYDEQMRQIGYGDDDVYTVLLEVRSETGLDIAAIDKMDAREFNKLCKSILRKRDRENWITVKRSHLIFKKTKLNELFKSCPNLIRNSTDRSFAVIHRDMKGAWVKDAYQKFYP